MTPMALQGRVALVTGSGQGIGQAIATLFAERGATAVFSDVVHGRAQAAAEAAAGAGHKTPSLAMEEPHK
jgi:3-oxoacyl-[acyl-carrier protein] reductase